MKLSKLLFWDVEYKTIDWQKNAPFVIGRVILHGTFEDWKKIKEYYGIVRLKREVVKLRYLDKKSLSFCSVYFNIPERNFRCFSTEQSIKKLWNY